MTRPFHHLVRLLTTTTFGLALSTLMACGEQDFEQDALQTECGATHAKVGFAAELETHFHDVSGTVVAVDDCTLEIRNFTYDGGGLDVRLVAAQGEAFGNGITLSDNMLGEPADGETRTFHLPDGVTLDDFDHLSIWCVAVSESFGDGQLKPAGS